ncbi:hypothetical protein MYAER_1556 [Microcystis aeruginosa NIES-2549]|uniref:Uncharacterized protein n=1 Tax=Microcystis aeruginosa NIES-2549 TaxID=1641812 RepID=A0A0F6RKZ1_MICAE|nr:hypothetical protein MYAER_1556 [Microcystis aeruginosa NIES-2549]AOC52298.1 hypothetical protein amyaer_1571 [Microcystis aeruginosa NIES-2481]
MIDFWERTMPIDGSRRVRSLMQVLLQSDRFWGTHHAH